ncbi:MAG: ABC transporter ATP-binding protein [Acidimicrobiia bacterium]
MADTHRPLVVAEGLGRDFGDVTALESLDLEMNGSEAIALIGHNGSGKTTALSMLAGRLEPSRGTVHIAGVDVHRRGGSDTVRALVSFIPDAPALYPDLTVADHLDLVGMAHGVGDAEERTDMLLDLFGLEERRYSLPRELSRGLRQKTQLACGLLRPYEVLILDEPVSGLDPPSRQALHSLLRRVKGEGALVVFSTHDLIFAEDLADRIVVVGDGRVAVVGTRDEVVASGQARELGLQ